MKAFCILLAGLAFLAFAEGTYAQSSDAFMKSRLGLQPGGEKHFAQARPSAAIGLQLDAPATKQRPE